MKYSFTGIGRGPIEFEAMSDVAAWTHCVESGLSTNRDFPVPGERLVCIEHRSVERPSRETLKRHVRFIAAANNVRSNQ